MHNVGYHNNIIISHNTVTNMFSTTTTEEIDLSKLEGVGSNDHYHTSRLEDPDDKQVWGCVGVWGCECEVWGVSVGCVRVWSVWGWEESITAMIVIVWHHTVLSELLVSYCYTSCAVLTSCPRVLCLTLQSPPTETAPSPRWASMRLGMSQQYVDL